MSSSMRIFNDSSALRSLAIVAAVRAWLSISAYVFNISLLSRGSLQDTRRLRVGEYHNVMTLRQARKIMKTTRLDWGSYPDILGLGKKPKYTTHQYDTAKRVLEKHEEDLLGRGVKMRRSNPARVAATLAGKSTGWLPAKAVRVVCGKGGQVRIDIKK